MRITPPIPREHGAWAVLIVPMLVGASVGGFAWRHVFLGICLLAVFLGRVPAETLLRKWSDQAMALDKFYAAAIWCAIYFAVAAVSALPLLSAGLWWLLGFGMVGAGLFAINFQLTRHMRQNVLTDLAAILGLTLSAPLAYYVATVSLDHLAWQLWLLNFLFFGSSAFYVHMKIQASAARRPEFSFVEKLSLGRLTLIYHFVATAIVAFLVFTNFTPQLAFIAFLPITVHAIYGTFKLSSAVRFKKLGLILLAHALVFGFLLALSHVSASANMSQPDQSEEKEVTSALPVHHDLQTRLNQAQSGDTVIVRSGVYEGNLLIEKRIVLIGEGSPVIRGDGKGSCITITADSCVIRGFVIERSGSMLVDEDAGILIKATHNLIAGNELRDVLFGIYFLEADSNTVVGNRVFGRKHLDLGGRGSGIHIWNSHHNRFFDNVIADARDGFYIQYANNTWIEGNEVYDLRYGLHYMYADSNVFLKNHFHDNVAGAAIMYSRALRMRHNRFVHNRGFSSFGILFQDCHGSVADSNVIADNVVGMFFEASTGNFFKHNIIAQNDLALQMFQNSTGNTFTENNFVDNLSPLAIVGKRTESLWSVEGRGNHWSGYEGYDLDHDGIGDVPMKIQNVFNYLEGRSPNLRLYLYSPASQALAVASKILPILEINQEVDKHPLMKPVEIRQRLKETSLALQRIVGVME